MPNDDTKYELPPWLPWATTACLAALVACIGEGWMLERTRAQFLRDQVALSDAALRGVENQLQAERIVGLRELESLRSGDKTRLLILLERPDGSPDASGPKAGAIVLNPSDGRAVVRLAAAAQSAGDDYQLWLESPGAEPADCGVFHAGSAGEDTLAEIVVTAAVLPGSRFVLVQGPNGGAKSLIEAESRGPIILASHPASGRLQNP